MDFQPYGWSKLPHDIIARHVSRKRRACAVRWNIGDYHPKPVRIEICHRCPHRAPPPYTGKMLCTIDNADIIEHASNLYCPLGRYRLGLGDLIARFLHVLGIQSALREMMAHFRELDRCWMSDEELAKPAGCGCGERQVALNQL